MNDKNRIAAYFILERFVRDNASNDTDYATHMQKIDVLSSLPAAQAAVIDAAKGLVRAWAWHQYTIVAHGEGEAELHFSKVQQAEEDFQTSVADLLAYECVL